MEFLKPIENGLVSLLKQPEMPAGGKKWFVKYLPILALIGGILQLLTALTLWRAWDNVDEYADFANSLARSVGVESAVDKPTMWFYLALLSVIVSAAILLMAYGPLKNKQKRGWDLLLLGGVLNVIYAVFVLFVGGTYGGGFGSFIFSLIGSTVGFWILIQIRSAYLHKSSAEKSES